LDCYFGPAFPTDAAEHFPPFGPQSVMTVFVCGMFHFRRLEDELRYARQIGLSLFGFARLCGVWGDGLDVGGRSRLGRHYRALVGWRLGKDGQESHLWRRYAAGGAHMFELGEDQLRLV